MKTVLIVEDEAPIAEVLADAFEDEGYRVVLARHGQAALARLAEEQPDLIISDIMMPVMDGRELIQRLRADINYQGIPIILISAAARSTSYPELKPGVFIPKPFSINHLLATAAQLIEDGA